MKKLFFFIVTLFLFLINYFIFKIDFSFYKELTLPNFSPKPSFFPIIWTILYILISLSVSRIFSIYGIKYSKDYNKSLFFNYLFNQAFTIIFFYFKNLFLGFIDCVFNFISSLFLYYETKELDKKSSYLLIPYIIFNLFACLLSLVIYFLNLNFI